MADPPACRRCLLVSTGDPAGIGPEIAMAALRLLGSGPSLPVVPVGDIGLLEEAVRLTGPPLPLVRLDPGQDIPSPVPLGAVLDVPLRSPVRRRTPSAPAGRHAFDILRACVDACLAGRAAGLVTCPVHKESLEQAGHGARGHTELLAELAGVDRVETVFCVGRLKIFFLTRHVSLRQAVDAVTRASLFQAMIRAHRVLRGLGVASPRIGIPGLNPHCGDGGLFGDEEIEQIVPAIRKARREGIDARGPIGADSIFHLGIDGNLDAIVALYHDQGHIAAKTYDFHGTVTLSLGLPFPRTSVDHGTAFDIAWRGKADSRSLVRAIELATEVLEAEEAAPPAP